jgi:hypothetical protein
MAYDAKDGYVVLFGGIGGVASTAPWYNDTWVFNSDNWTELHPRVSPPRTLGAGMVYDGADGYVVLFGGEWLGANGRGSLVNNYTWEFSAGEWTNITSTPSPPQCNRPNMAYDPVDGHVVLFGGWNPNVVTPVNNTTEFIGGDLNYTWMFSGGRWTNITPAMSPEGRDSAFMSYDSADGYILMFGGKNTNFTALNDTWEFRNGKWTQLFPSSSPPARELGGIVYDPGLNAVVIFGGDSGTIRSFSNETWEFSEGNWTQLHPKLSPEPRAAIGLVFDALDGYIVLFGGGPLPNDYFGSFNDTWVLRPVAVPPPTSLPWWDSPIIAYIASGAVLTLVAIGVIIWRVRRKKESMDLHAGSIEDLGNPPQQGVGGTHEPAPAILPGR